MVCGQGDQINRGDTKGGFYFFDVTNLTWSLKYQPSEYRVRKTIYNVIGGNGQDDAILTILADDKGFSGGLGKLFAIAANRNNFLSTGGGSSSSTGAIVGSVIGGVALLAAIGPVGSSGESQRIICASSPDL
ncbi:hypothetical protein HOY80DRAFT_1140804 [Tuber brumale]|nr:hypothetical protein HOY80DRAFT_1140804 [Tuber brumale]